jgi:hypothetical protein
MPFMLPPTRLMNLFSPNPNDTHSSRTTPSSVGGTTSGRSTATTVNLVVVQSHLICSQI